MNRWKNFIKFILKYGFWQCKWKRLRISRPSEVYNFATDWITCGWLKCCLMYSRNNIIYCLIAFMGYVLPFGQMSIWGATVITNLISAIPYIGNDLVVFIWGGFSVGNPTLNRFYSLHYLLPFLLAGLVLYHMMSLHENGFKGPKLNLLLFILSAFSIPNTKAIKRIGPHNIDILSILFGSLLGDAHAERLNNGGVRFIFKQSIIHKEYLFYLYTLLNNSGYVNNNFPSMSVSKYGISYSFKTYSYSNLLWLYKSFYNNKIKVLPNYDLLFYFLTPLALAIWIMDDGTRHSNGIRIATHCFTLKEVELLRDILINKYNFIVSIHKNNNKHIIYISSKSLNSLKLLVKPYFHSSMLYKLG